ncbi:hypothetical protein Scep_011115 [Stephania cephalantha]|uniref:Uncharacterized protein n=1 Tax=Stephania cephalantha TaxID=152367 RepID=A0AAP0P595_9MAGN
MDNGQILRKMGFCLGQASTTWGEPGRISMDARDNMHGTKMVQPTIMEFHLRREEKRVEWAQYQVRPKQ